MNETHRLLREYVDAGSEAAFGELVRRYINLVYSVAVRQVSGDVHRAQDVVQTVFCDLARKAAQLPGDVTLGGWLHRHCCFVASDLRRAESSRVTRETEAALMTSLHHEDQGTDWQQLAPVLDEAIQELSAPDRDALIRRFFERQDFRTIGAALGASEDAAQKRVTRALEKLRQLISARAVVPSIAGLEGLLHANSVSAAPAGWASQISSAALRSIPAKAGLAAASLALLSTSGFKVAALAALLVGGILAWQWPHFRHYTALFESPTASEAVPATAASPPITTPGAASPSSVLAASPAEVTSNALKLIIVAADTLQPLPQVPIEFRAVGSSGKFHNKDLVADSDGICLVPFLDEPFKRLELTTRLEGYADTRLLWHPERGHKIPETYTLKLRHATPVSGTVLDANGNPVSGAQVGFNHEQEPAMATLVETPLFSWIAVETDSAGRWRMNRIADEMISSLRGGASHPEHVGSPYFEVSRTPASEEQLRKGTHVFRLGTAVVVRGVVVETGGAPIPNAKVLVGERGMAGSREAVTELDGSFEIKGCKPGSNPMTAEAPQYAPATVNVELQPNSEPLRLVLAPGKILKLRVVNAGGQPIPKANVWLNHRSHLDPAIEKQTLPRSQAAFSPRTDADGRVFWDQAPDEELIFDFAAKGYMRRSEVKVRPDGSEHTIVLEPALTIRGTVRDAETGAFIPRFKLITGWPETNFLSGKVTGRWSPIDRFWLSFADGKFEHSYEEPILGGVTDPAFIFKIEADGYAPFISRTVKATEGVVELNVALAKSKPLAIRVLNPDGSPAPNTAVLFAGASHHVRLTGNGFDSYSGGTSLLSDETGTLAWQPEEDVATVIAANRSGFAFVTSAELQQQPVIHLQSWGRVEVTYRTLGEPGLGRKISIQRSDRKPDEAFVQLSDPLETDSQGRVTFAKVPPGHYELSYLAPMGKNDNSSIGVPFANLEVRPGETTIHDHNEVGAEVRVRPLWPSGFTLGKEHQTFAGISTPGPVIPPEFQDNITAVRQWAQTPEIQAAHRNMRHYRLTETQPGIWTSPPIPPGTYNINIQASKLGNPGNLPTEAISGTKEITIPENPDELYDAGDLPLELREAKR
jgi:RNA polymerase sigma factor (sigma-70 family)